MTIIYDANNWVRLQLEASPYIGMSVPRGLLHQFINTNEPTIFIWDGKNSLKSRREIFPEYKMQRKPANNDIYVNFDMIREVLNLCPVVQVRVDGFEADDVIAQIIEPGDTLYSTDRDFRQLENVNLPITRPIGNVEAQYIRTYKTLVGDASDGIPGVKGFGEKTWEMNSPEQWQEWVGHILSGRHQVLSELNLPPRIANALDYEQIIKFWTVVGFIPVPEDKLRAGITVGKANFAVADAFLKELLQ